MFKALHHTRILKAQLKAATIWETEARLGRINIPTTSQLKNTTESSGVIIRTGFQVLRRPVDKEGGSSSERQGLRLKNFLWPAPQGFASGSAAVATSSSASALQPGSGWWEWRWRQLVFERDKQVPTYSHLPAVSCLLWVCLLPLFVALTRSQCVQLGGGPPQEFNAVPGASRAPPLLSF